MKPDNMKQRFQVTNKYVLCFKYDLEDGFLNISIKSCSESEDTEQDVGRHTADSEVKRMTIKYPAGLICPFPCFGKLQRNQCVFQASLITLRSNKLLLGVCAFIIKQM